MIDISTVGSKIYVKFFDMATPLVIDEFSDEGTPFESPDADASTNKKNLNGHMVSSRTPNVHPVSLTVIPGTKADMELQRRLADASIQPDRVTKIEELNVEYLTVSVPQIDMSGTGKNIDYTFKNGRIKGGPLGPSSSAEGRMSARTYTFEFEKYQPPTFAGTSV